MLARFEADLGLPNPILAEISSMRQWVKGSHLNSTLRYADERVPGSNPGLCHIKSLMQSYLKQREES